MATQAELTARAAYIAKRDKARADAATAMLAALELVKADPAANMLSSATWNDIKVAIAQAKAAGIKL